MIDNSHFVKYVADTGTDLSQHLLIDRLCTLKLDPREFENFANKHREEIATHFWVKDVMKSGYYLNDGRGTIQGFIC